MEELKVQHRELLDIFQTKWYHCKRNKPTKDKSKSLSFHDFLPFS
jgi:hypothetical protein